MARIAKMMVQYHKAGGSPGVQKQEEALRLLAREFRVLEDVVDKLVTKLNDTDNDFRALQRKLDAYLNPKIKEEKNDKLVAKKGKGSIGSMLSKMAGLSRI
jgi:hypothetical protein